MPLLPSFAILEVDTGQASAGPLPLVLGDGCTCLQHTLLYACKSLGLSFYALGVRKKCGTLRKKGQSRAAPVLLAPTVFFLFLSSENIYPVAQFGQITQP